MAFISTAYPFLCCDVQNVFASATVPQSITLKIFNKPSNYRLAFIEPNISVLYTYNNGYLSSLKLNNLGNLTVPIYSLVNSNTPFSITNDSGLYFNGADKGPPYYSSDDSVLFDYEAESEQFSFIVTSNVSITGAFKNPF